MKTIKLFLAILTIIATISACKKDAEVGPQGPTGSTGATGATGPTGTANIIQFDIIINKNKWQMMDTSRWYAEIDNSENSNINLFYSFDSTSAGINPHQIFWTCGYNAPLPFVNYDTICGNKIIPTGTYSYSINPWGTFLTFYITGINSSKISSPPDGDLWFISVVTKK